MTEEKIFFGHSMVCDDLRFVRDRLEQLTSQLYVDPVDVELLRIAVMQLLRKYNGHITVEARRTTFVAEAQADLGPQHPAQDLDQPAGDRSPVSE